MRNIMWPLAILLIIGLGASGVQSASNVSAYMEDFLRQNQLQYDLVLKDYETKMANFRTNYAGELRAIDVQKELLVVKLEEASGRLRPIELIDTWHKQCVQNYSASIPTIASVRTTLTACKTAAENQLNGYLTNCQNTYNSLKSYYNNNFKTMINNCEKNNPISQLNYSICVTNSVS